MSKIEKTEKNIIHLTREEVECLYDGMQRALSHTMSVGSKPHTALFAYPINHINKNRNEFHLYLQQSSLAEDRHKLKLVAVAKYSYIEFINEEE